MRRNCRAPPLVPHPHCRHRPLAIHCHTHPYPTPIPVLTSHPAPLPLPAPPSPMAAYCKCAASCSPLPIPTPPHAPPLSCSLFHHPALTPTLHHDTLGQSRRALTPGRDFSQLSFCLHFRFSSQVRLAVVAHCRLFRCVAGAVFLFEWVRRHCRCGGRKRACCSGTRPVPESWLFAAHRRSPTTWISHPRTKADLSGALRENLR